MTSIVLPFKAKRCDTRALHLVREQVKESLIASKAEKERENLFLNLICTLARIYIAFAWALAVLVMCVAALGLPVGLVLVAVRFAHLK